MEITLGELAEKIGGTPKGDTGKPIRGVAPFDSAKPDELTFIESENWLKKKEMQTEAGAVIVPEKMDTPFENTISVKNSRLALARSLELFFPKKTPEDRISADARIGENVSLGKDVTIDPFARIGDNVRIGDRVYVHSFAFIGNGVFLEEDVCIMPNVSILDGCRIGKRVIVHSGTVVGSDGFGFVREGEEYVKIPQTGTVRIGDDTEIGALNAIDRATFGETRIGRGVKTDNLVHIAHNVTIGDNSVIVAQVGISGSVTIGKNAVLAGQAGISGHLTLGDNVTIGPQAGVGKPVSDGEIVSGSPGIPHKLWLRVQNIVSRLPDLKKSVGDLEKRVRKLETAEDDE
jgi:UDP-3-O-[3-hydroxymyristoyl] glucosamine N-acyltransferase